MPDRAINVKIVFRTITQQQQVLIWWLWNFLLNNHSNDLNCLDFEVWGTSTFKLKGVIIWKFPKSLFFSAYQLCCMCVTNAIIVVMWPMVIWLCCHCSHNIYRVYWIDYIKCWNINEAINHTNVCNWCITINVEYEIMRLCYHFCFVNIAVMKL